MPKLILTALFVAASLSVYSNANAIEPVSADTVPWQSCMNSEFMVWFEGLPPDPELRCGYLDVPLQYQTGSSIAHRENSQAVRLALTLLPAKGTRKGSLVAIGGGPGMPGINPNIETDWPVSRLRESWDIVGYDPRGVGQSTPKIACPPRTTSHGDTNTSRGPNSRVLDELASCIKHTGATVLQHIGTDEAVSDLDRIRQALGEAKLTSIGWSYGTLVAAMYAERFPSKTRALVLDGVINLAQDYATERFNQMQGFQQSFDRFTAWCVKKGDCPLPSNNQKALAYFRSLLNRLDKNPLLTENYGNITAHDLIVSTIFSLYSSSTWPVISASIRELEEGVVSKNMIKFSQMIVTKADGYAHEVIRCADTAQPGMDMQILRRQRQDIEQALAFANYLPSYEHLPYFCDVWPWPGKLQPHMPVPAKQLPQLLFVSRRYDPATPWLNARVMANAFNSPLITLERDGHGVALSRGNICVDESVVGYLMNPDKPLPDQTCL